MICLGGASPLFCYSPPVAVSFICCTIHNLLMVLVLLESRCVHPSQPAATLSCGACTPLRAVHLPETRVVHSSVLAEQVRWHLRRNTKLGCARSLAHTTDVPCRWAGKEGKESEGSAEVGTGVDEAGRKAEAVDGKLRHRQESTPPGDTGQHEAAH